MRIAEVCVRFGAPGGAESHVAALAGRLARRGHEVVVFTSDLFTEIPWKRGGPFEEPPPGVEVVRLPITARTIPLKPIRMPGLRAALAASRADVFHAHSHRYHHLRTTASVARRLGRPWCVTPHFHPIEAREPAWKRALASLADGYDARRVYRGAARVFTVTELERRYVAHLARVESLVTIPNGIDLALWSGAISERAFRKASGAGRPFVLYAGRLASNKGLGHLLDAWAKVAPRHDEVDLVLAGRDWGEGEGLARKASELGLADRVRFVGHLDDEAYRSAIASCRALVLPSEWEAFGIVLLEAMARERPVVATAVGGVPDVVADGEDGLLVQYGDPAALARALDAVLSDAALAERLGAAGRAKAARYDWDRVAERLEAELTAVARGPAA